MEAFVAEYSIESYKTRPQLRKVFEGTMEEWKNLMKIWINNMNSKIVEVAIADELGFSNEKVGEGLEKKT